MGYVFGEIWPLLLAGLAIGFLLGYPAGRGLARGRHEEHARQLADRDAQISSLRAEAGKLAELRGDLDAARSRIVHLEGDTAELSPLRERLAASERVAAEVGGLRARVGELEPEAALVPGMRERITELEARSSELDVFRTRFVNMDREARDLKTQIAELREDQDAERLTARIAELQERVTELEASVREGEALKARIAELEARRAADGGADRATRLQRELDAMTTRHRQEVALLAAARQDAEELRRRLAGLEGGAPQAAAPSRDPAPAAFAAVPGPEIPVPPPPGDEPVLDLAEGSRILGRRLRQDDLIALEGVGPKIARLCNEQGITTWRQLSMTPVPRLEAILAAAGSAYAVHDPASWPHQAALLADGRWTEFRELINRLRGGRY